MADAPVDCGSFTGLCASSAGAEAPVAVTERTELGIRFLVEGYWER
jgi:hypothetical protein